MRREAKRILVIVGVLVLWISLFQNIDLARAKDPDYPTKPINFLIGLSAGGSTDLACRAIIGAANKHLSQPITPINRLGASGAVAIKQVITAPPDGYTIGFFGMSATFVNPFSEGTPYGVLTDEVTWLANVGTYVFPAIVPGDAPWKTWRELIEYAKKNPRAIKFASTGTKKADYKGLTLWQIEQREQVEFTYLVFKGSPECLTAILGGHVSLYGSTVDASTMEFVRTGKLRILAFLGQNKVPGYTDIPSTKEIYGFGIPDLLAIGGPKGLPDYVVRTLEDAFAKGVKDPDFIQVMNKMHMPVLYMDRPTSYKHIKEAYSETSKIYERVKAAEEKAEK